MSKVILTSTGFQNPNIGVEFLKLVNKPVSDVNVLFIPTAARSDGEKFYVNKSKIEILKLGVKEENIMTFDLDRDISFEELVHVDALFFCGGNTYYLLYKIKERGFDSIVRRLVEYGKVFVGASAGSVVSGPDIGFISIYDENDIGLSDTTGLELIGSGIIPHYSNEEDLSLEKAKKRTDFPIITLTDNQALVLSDGESRIIE